MRNVESKIQEEWRDIPNYEGNYKVSNMGRIQSYIYYNSKTISKRTRILKPFPGRGGYLRVCLTNKEGDKKFFLIHRIVMLAFYGYSDLQVNHINGVKTDNRFSNLEYVTQSDNMKHAYRIGLEKPCDNGFKRKISVYKDDKIINTFNSIRDMCRNLNLDRRSVKKVLCGNYKHHHNFTFKLL